MTSDQKTVAIGAVSGIISMVVAVAALTHVLPTPANADGIAERLAFALGANAFALVPLFLMLVTIGNQRFLSTAIDPTRHAENAAMEIDGRVTDNTLQQNFVFAIASLAASTRLPPHDLQAIWACAIWFVVARFAFWFGYRWHPLYRAPGMAGTAYLNLGLIAYVLVRLVW